MLECLERKLDTQKTFLVCMRLNYEMGQKFTSDIFFSLSQV